MFVLKTAKKLRIHALLEMPVQREYFSIFIKTRDLGIEFMSEPFYRNFFQFFFAT